MGLYAQFDISDYGYANECHQGLLADLIPFQIETDYTPACEAFVNTFMKEAQSLVPVRTGYLKSTINATTDGFHCSAEATAEYAEYVEYGTWHMNEQPYFTPALEKAIAVFIEVADDIKNDTMEQVRYEIKAKANHMIMNATDPFLLFFLFMLIIFLREIIKMIFDDIFGGYKSRSRLPEITIIS